MREVTIQVPDHFDAETKTGVVLGYVGENLATKIIFDLEQWLPYATPSSRVNLEVRLPSGRTYMAFADGYPFNSEANRYLNWIITAGYLTKSGTGRIVLNLTDGGDLNPDQQTTYKSAMMDLTVYGSLSADTSGQPEGPDWVIDYETITIRVERAAQDAEIAKADAEAAKSDAEQAAQAAQEAAETVEEVVTALGGFSFALDPNDLGLNITYTE